MDWDAAVAAYEAVRTEHCRRVVLTARSWGELWHLDGTARRQRNVILRSRAVDDYSFVDWLHGPTALAPEDLPPMFETRIVALCPFGSVAPTFVTACSWRETDSVYSPFEPVADELDYPSDPTLSRPRSSRLPQAVGQDALNATPLTDGDLYPGPKRHDKRLRDK
ncbi:hypothetical protein [Saccharomonospora cyanea]|uniref:hypothetical protein n=1 Tax=Saccharomonospora cyanea TaxID=40989 RepID=UPI002FC38482